MHIVKIILTTSVICLAQDVPKIGFQSTHYDFGKIYGDKKVCHRFVVTNKGQSLLNISKLNPSCGCASTVLGKWTLTPNEAANVEVIFNPTGLCGLIKRSVQVISNDQNSPVTTLTFSAEVIREVMPSTTSVFFDHLTAATSKKVSIKLVSGNSQPVRITKIESQGVPYLAFFTQHEGNDIKLEITINGRNIPNGKYMGVDNVYVHTANTKMPITISVQWDLL